MSKETPRQFEMPPQPGDEEEIPLGPPLEKREVKGISEEEYKERLERLRSMGRVVGEDFDMGVGVGKERGWRYIFKPVNKIEVDPIDVAERGLDYCFGVIAHEGSHRKISRTDFIPKSVWQEMGFSYLMNAVEDPRVNNWVSEKYDGARDWLERVYAEDFPPEEWIDNKARKKLGYTPKHVQFGLEVIRHWHTGKFLEKLPEDVKEALDKTIKYAELAYGTLPEKDPTDEDIKDKAQLMYKVVYSAIWPEYSKLVDKAFDDEKWRQMLKDMIENGEIELGDEGKGEGGEPLPLDALPEDLREQLKKKIKEKLEGMSPEERKKFEEEAEKKAEETLDGLESDLNKEIKGKFSEQPETKAEEKEREDREAKEAEEAKKRAAEIKAAKREIEKKLEAERSEYDKALMAVKPYIDKVAEDIINLFITARFPKWQAKFPGQKARLAGAREWASRKEYRRLFEERLPVERKDYTFLLLVDLSGSMKGQKIEETFKGAVLFAEALNRVAQTLGGVKVAVYGSHHRLFSYKTLDQELDNKLRTRMSTMKKRVKDKDAGTSLAYWLDHVSTLLEQTNSKNQFLFVLSDGVPEPDKAHRVERYKDLEADAELKKVVKDISQKTKQRVLAVGLGPNTEHVSQFFTSKLERVDNIPNIDVKQLAEVLGKKLEELVK